MENNDLHNQELQEEIPDEDIPELPPSNEFGDILPEELTDEEIKQIEKLEEQRQITKGNLNFLTQEIKRLQNHTHKNQKIKIV